MTAFPLYHVDAFAEGPFTGNPAAVCLLDEPAGEEWMQNVAMEMNLSETAFLVRRDDGYGLRWFTPAQEVDLCGHATLASAHVLWEAGHLDPDETARFHTASGELTAVRRDEWIEMDFPSHTVEPIPPPEALLQAIGAEPRYVGRSKMYLLVELESEQVVRILQPDMKLLREVETPVIITSAATTLDYDFVSRFFCPALGINEDPVTGSAHCALGPYWRNRLDKTEMMAYQDSPRGGVVKVRIADDRTFLGGRAVTIFQGELFAPTPRQTAVSS